MKFLWKLMAPEFQALAEAIDSLDLSNLDGVSRWWEIQKFTSEHVHGMRWHEKVLLRHTFNKVLRQQAKVDAMCLVMRVPTEGTSDALRGRATSKGFMLNTNTSALHVKLDKANENKRVILKRKETV